MSSISDFLSNAYNYTDWSAHKVVQAVKSGQIYTLAPAALGCYTTYKSLRHLATATFGTDSWEHRTKNCTRGLFNHQVSYGGVFTLSKRCTLLAKAALGSISLKDRAIELGYSLGYLAASFFVFYGLHAYLQKEQEINFPGDPQMSAADREMFPDRHAYEVSKQALNFLGQNERFVEYSIIPSANAAQINSAPAFKAIDHIFKAQETPVRKALSYINSAVVYCVPQLNAYSYFQDPAFISTKDMNPSELKAAYDKAKELIEAHAKTDYEGLNASYLASAFESAFSWIPGIDAKARAAGLEKFLHPNETNDATLAIKKLDKLYSFLRQRLILLGQGSLASGSSEEVADYEAIYSRAMGITQENLPSWSTISSYVSGKIGAYADPNYLYSITPNALYNGKVQLASLKSLSEVDLDACHKALSNSIPTNLRSITVESLKPIRQAAASFYGLDLNFDKKAFKKAFRVLSLSVSGDKTGNDATLDKVMEINTAFNEIFGREEGYLNEALEIARSSSLSFIPMPDQVVQDIWTSFTNWWSSPIHPNI